MQLRIICPGHAECTAKTAAWITALAHYPNSLHSLHLGTLGHNMTEFAKRARDLVKEIVTYEANSLPAYNEELMRLALIEVNEHNTQAQHILDQHRQHVLQAEKQRSTGQTASDQDQLSQELSKADQTAVLIHLEAVARTKRLLLSYMMQRVDRLKYMRWQHRQLPAHIEPLCSQQEAELYRSYDKLLSKYMNKQQGIGHDLTLDCNPPKDNTVQVLVTKDAGAHMFSFGRLSLIEGALLRLPADEAEPFIKAGVLCLHDRSEFL